MQNSAGTAEHIALPAHERVGKWRRYHYARLPKVKEMARCAVLLMSLSLIAGCASSPRESLTETAKRALPSYLGTPELVEEVRWHIFHGVTPASPSPIDGLLMGLTGGFPSGVQTTQHSPCTDAVATFADRFVLLRRTQSSREATKISGYDRQGNPTFTRDRSLVCETNFSRAAHFSYADIQTISIYPKRDLVGRSYQELRVFFEPALSQHGGTPQPQNLLMELGGNSEIPRILDQRRRR